MKHKTKSILIRRERERLLEELKTKSFTISLAEETEGFGDVKYSNRVISLDDVLEVFTPEEVVENSPFEKGDEVIVVGNEGGHNRVGSIFTVSVSGPYHSYVEDDFSRVTIRNSDIIKLKYPKVGDKVTVVANNTGHEFDIFTTLTVHRPGLVYSTLKGEDESERDLRNDEFEVVESIYPENILATDQGEEAPKVEKLKSHGDLTVDEVKRKKRELKEGLFNLLNQFYEETGVKVYGKIYNSPINSKQVVNLDFSNPIE